MTDTMTAPPAPPPPAPAPTVHRSRADRMIAGVAGGVAERYGWDPALVRIVFVLIGLMSAGSGIVAYAIAWLVIPEGPEEPSIAARSGHRGRLWLGAVLLGLGLVSLLDLLDLDGPAEVLWPLMLIAGGVALLVVRHGAEAPVGTPDPDPLRRTATGSAAPSTFEAVAPTRTESAYRDQGPWPAGPPAPPSGPPTTPRPTRAPRGPLGAITWGTLLVYAGGVWLLHAAEVVDVTPLAVVAGALGIIGVALVVSAWWGRAPGLVPLGLVVAAVGTVVSLVDVPWDAGVGDPVYRPTSAAEVRDRYELTAGELRVDLGALALTPGERVTITAETGIGELRVLVPAGTPVEVRAHADLGEIQVPGRDEVDGADVDDRTDPLAVGTGGIVLDLEVGIGAVVVEEVTPRVASTTAAITSEVTR